MPRLPHFRGLVCVLAAGGLSSLYSLVCVLADINQILSNLRKRQELTLQASLTL
jgi:hypothetical protein